MSHKVQDAGGQARCRKLPVEDEAASRIKIATSTTKNVVANVNKAVYIVYFQLRYDSAQCNSAAPEPHHVWYNMRCEVETIGMLFN